MKVKFYILTLFVTLGFCGEIEISCDEKYSKSICGDDFSCVAEKCIYKNTNLIGAYQRFFRDYILNTEGNERDIYTKAAADSNLPSVGQTIKIRHRLNKNMSNVCEFEFKRLSRKHLIIKYNECSFESSFKVDFRLLKNDVEVVLSGDSGA